jgi:hypothetical protein
MRPEHGIGVRNGMKALEGLMLLVKIGSKAIRMPAFY